MKGEKDGLLPHDERILFELFRIDNESVEPKIGSHVLLPFFMRSTDTGKKVRKVAPPTAGNFCEDLGIYKIAETFRQKVEEVDIIPDGAVWRRMMFGLQKLKFQPCVERIREYLKDNQRFQYYFYAIPPKVIEDVPGEVGIRFIRRTEHNVLAILPRTFSFYMKTMEGVGKTPSEPEIAQIGGQVIYLARRMSGHMYGNLLETKSTFDECVSGWIDVVHPDIKHIAEVHRRKLLAP